LDLSHIISPFGNLHQGKQNFPRNHGRSVTTIPIHALEVIDQFHSNAEKFITLVNKAGLADEKQVEQLFERLPPVSPETLIGEWQGYSVNTGHIGVEKNKELKWAGKTFRSVDDADPMVLLDDSGKRFWLESAGCAKVRFLSFGNCLKVFC
jgi:hypothetical protein